jgi:hypothetical protein
VTDVTVTALDPSAELRLHRLTGTFLAGYRNANTRASYLQQLHRWFAWCTDHKLDPLAIERTHVELYLRWFERQVGSINTVCHGLSVLASFYRWLVQTGLADTTPHRRRASSLAGRDPAADPAHPPRARGLAQHRRDRRRSRVPDGVPAAAQRAAGLGGLRHRHRRSRRGALARAPLANRTRSGAPGVEPGWLHHRIDGLIAELVLDPTAKVFGEVAPTQLR